MASFPPPPPPSPSSALLHGSCNSLELRLTEAGSFQASTSAGPAGSGSACPSTHSALPWCRRSARSCTHTHTHISGSRWGAGPAGPRTDTHSLGDTQVVVDLADQRVPVLLPLRPDRDQLQGVGPSTELPVHRSHHWTGAVGQVDPADGALRSRRRGQDPEGEGLPEGRSYEMETCTYFQTPERRSYQRGGATCTYLQTPEGRSFLRGGATRGEELAAHLSPLIVRVPPVGDAEP